jgi:hypothetical protein
LIEATLREIVINPEVKHIVGDFATDYDLWRGTLADRFFDMGTMVRLGTAIELGLRSYYMDRKGHSTLVDLRNDPRYQKNIFQRVQSGQPNGVIVLYSDAIGYDLTSNPHLQSIQETMMHRHLYAHNSGLLDDEYIEKIQRITGEDIRTRPAFTSSNYPAEDVYWFEPLTRLNVFIEEARRFFRQFPS